MDSPLEYLPDGGIRTDTLNGQKHTQVYCIRQSVSIDWVHQCMVN